MARYLRWICRLLSICFAALMVLAPGSVSAHQALVRGPGSNVAFDHFQYLPAVIQGIPGPVLSGIDNADLDNQYTVVWSPISSATGYVLEEANEPTFTITHTVYTGPGTSWATGPAGKASATYYYRVRAYNGTASSVWSNIRSVEIYPLFMGLQTRWDGNGQIRGSQNVDAGYHRTMVCPQLAGLGQLKCDFHTWYDPNPLNFPIEDSSSVYAVTSGMWLSSTVTLDPAWKWSFPRYLPYHTQLYTGTTYMVTGDGFTTGQPFVVTGLSVGMAPSGRPWHYWSLVNTGDILVWDGGGDWKQYIRTGEAHLNYDVATGAIVSSDVLRRIYYQNSPHSDTIQYVDHLTESTGMAQFDIPTPGIYGDTRRQVSPFVDTPARSMLYSLP